MAKNKSARDYLLYASATTPSTASAASSYTLVGLMTEHNLNRSRGSIDVSTKDSGDDSTFISGRRNQTLSGSGIFDHTEDAGYTVLSNVYESASGLVYFLLTSTTNGDTEWHGSGILTDLSLTFADESPSTFSMSVQVSGTLTEVTGTTT